MSSNPPSRKAADAAVEARRIEGGRSPATNEFSYSVVARPAPAPAPPAASDKRRGARQRTRLRTGKIVDMAGRFVTECLVFDRSETGIRLRLPAGVAIAAALLRFYDDQTGELHQADVMWRRENEIGIRVRPGPPSPADLALAAEMRRRFYAVPN